MRAGESATISRRRQPLDLMTRHPNPRVAAARVDALFIDRWSPRSFSPEPLTDADIASMFEAARWAPSSSNVQPWLFLYETDGPDREVFDSILKPRNREWAAKAPFLGFLFANTRTADGREPRTAQFDAGAAWMSLALQALALGIHTHGMAASTWTRRTRSWASTPGSGR